MTATLALVHSAPSCRRCSLQAICGGTSDTPLFSCFAGCRAGLCEKADWTCPCRGGLYAERWREAKSPPWQVRQTAPLLPLTAELPLYIPRIAHACRRQGTLGLRTVALSLYDVLRLHHGKRYRPVASTPVALRRKFRLAPGTPVLILSVGFDRSLELFWSQRNVSAALERLARLNILGATVPNFSFFIEAPRTHTLWNRRRIQLLAEELSRAGIAPILHLNAQNELDWEFWRTILQEQPALRYVAKEFQTGLKEPRLGTAAVWRLADLQNKLGRPLHPVLIAGRVHAEEAAQRFERFTIVDTVPFLGAMCRQVASVEHGELKWNLLATAPNQPLDDRLERNIAVYEAALRAKVAGTPAAVVEPGAVDDQGQLGLPFAVNG